VVAQLFSLGRYEHSHQITRRVCWWIIHSLDGFYFFRIGQRAASEHHADDGRRRDLSSHQSYSVSHSVCLFEKTEAAQRCLSYDDAVAQSVTGANRRASPVVPLFSVRLHRAAMKNVQFTTDKKLWLYGGLTIFVALWFAPVLPPGIDWDRPAGLWVELFKAPLASDVSWAWLPVVIFFLLSRIVGIALIFSIPAVAVGWVIHAVIVIIRQKIRTKHDPTT